MKVLKPEIYNYLIESPGKVCPPTVIFVFKTLYLILSRPSVQYTITICLPWWTAVWFLMAVCVLQNLLLPVDRYRKMMPIFLNSKYLSYSIKPFLFGYDGQTHSIPIIMSYMSCAYIQVCILKKEKPTSANCICLRIDTQIRKYTAKRQNVLIARQIRILYCCFHFWYVTSGWVCFWLK